MGKNTPKKSSYTKDVVELNRQDQPLAATSISRGSVRQKIAMFEKKKQQIVTSGTGTGAAIVDEFDVTEEEQYDLTPVMVSPKHSGIVRSKSVTLLSPIGSPVAYAVDPFEFTPEKNIDNDDDDDDGIGEEHPLSPTSSCTGSQSYCSNEEEEYTRMAETTIMRPDRSIFFAPGDIHPNMESNDNDIQRLRLLASRLSADWRHVDILAPALARRVRDFQFAQEKRRKKYGDERPWGILGVYDHLASIRIDVEWAEDAARRRANGDAYQSWADFDESKKGGRNRPYFTYILLFLCTAILIASIAVNGWSIEPLDENPMIGPSAETLILMGAKDSTLIVVEKQVWRLLSSAFLHAGLVHYVINMLALRFVGAAVEMSHGWFVAFMIFTLSAVGGTILSAIFLPYAISVGASGGIFGFIGACLADIMMNWSLLFSDIVTENGKKHRHATVVLLLLLDIILNCIIGLTPYVDNFSHLGGMAYGLLCGLSTIQRLSADFFGVANEGWTGQAKQIVTRFFGVIVSLASIIITLVVLFEGDPNTAPCPGCTWLSCIPFPPWEDHDNKWWYCDDCGRVTADVISKPSLHLAVDCPSGAIAYIDLDEKDYDRETVQKRLPRYCREYCPLFEAGHNASTLNLL